MINLTKLDRTNRQLGTSEPGQGDEARAAGAVAGGAWHTGIVPVLDSKFVIFAR